MTSRYSLHDLALSIVLPLFLSLPCSSLAGAYPAAHSAQSLAPLEQTIEKLRREYELFPYRISSRNRLAAAYHALGLSQLEQRLFDLAANSFEQARVLVPEQQDSAILRGIALYLGKRYDEAAFELERARLAGDTVDVLDYLGRVHYDIGDLPRALELWEQAQLLAPENGPLRDKIAKVRREALLESGMSKGYRSLFDLSYDAATRPDLADDLLVALEEAFRRVGSDFDHYPAVHIPVILYTRKDYRGITASPEWSGGLYDGKVRLPIAGERTLTPQLRGLLFHEYTHVVVRELSKGNCPTWLNEGLAEVEGRTQYDSPLTALAVAARGGGLLPMASLGKSFAALTASDVALAYQQSYSLVSFMIKSYGWYKVNDILANLGSGMTIEAAIAKALADYAVVFHGIEREWAEAVRRQFAAS